MSIAIALLDTNIRRICLIEFLCCPPVGVPPPPRFLNLVARQRQVHGRPYAGIDVLFSSCDQGAVLSYTVEVSIDANFSSLIENVTNTVSNMSRTLEVDGLQENTTYWMRMKAVGVGGESLYSAAQMVETLTGRLCYCIMVWIMYNV